MAKITGVESITMELRAEKIDLTNQLQQVDAALSAGRTERRKRNSPDIIAPWYSTERCGQEEDFGRAEGKVG